MFEASPFKLNMFLRCPRQYQFQYIDKLGGIYRKPRPYFTMGDHVHAALKDFFSVTPTDERNTTKLENLLREKWQRNRKGFKDREDEKRWGQKAIKQLQWFALNQDLSITPFKVEDYHKVALTENITLIGRIDRIDREADDTLHIIDYKTGEIPAEIDQIQLHMYALILSQEQALPVSKASYLYLEPGKWHTIEPATMDLEKAQAYIVDLVDKICAERAYPATPNEYCGNCDFLEICPEKEAAAKSILSDEELDF